MRTDERAPRRSIAFPSIFYGWYIVAAGMGIHLWVSIAWIYGMQVFFTPVVTTFGWSRAAVSGALSMQRIEGSIASPIEGLLLDRFGPRKMVLVGVFILGLGLISLSFLQSLWMFYVSVLLVALGTSASSGLPRNWSIVQWFRRLRGRALGIGASGAVLSGPLLFIVVWLVETLGWRVAFVILGIATWCICAPLGLVFRSTPHQYGYLPDGDPPIATGEETHAARARPGGHSPSDTGGDSFTVRQALATPAFWLFTLIFGAQTMGVSGLLIHMIPFFQSIGFSPAKAASVLAVYTVLSAFGRLGGGWAMDFFDRRVVLAVLLGCQAAAFLILSNVSSYWQTLPFALLYGTAFGGMIPARSAVISTYFGTRSFGAIQGLAQSATVVAGFVSPILMGFIFDATQSYVLSFYILAAVAAVAIPLPFLARAPRLPEEAAS